MSVAATVRVPVVGEIQRRWLFIGAGAIGLVVIVAYVRRARKPAAVYSPSGGSINDLPVGYDNPAPTAPSSGFVDDPNIISNNAQWSRQAVDALEGASWDRQYAATVIGKYLAGQPLTPEEVNLVLAAKALVGDPPNPIAIVAIPSAPPAGPPSSPPPSSAPAGTPRRYVVVVKYSTPNPSWKSYLQGIASHTGRSVAQLASWNSIGNVNLIYPGQKVYIDPPGSYSGEQQIN